MNLEDKIKIVENILKDKKVAIGFSGGADSTLLTYLSSKFAKDTLAITIDNNLFSTGFVENTKKACKTFGVTHKIIGMDFWKESEILLNNQKRCFNCRNLMYTTIEKIARENGYEFICDGNNISDLIQDRPGILITYEKGFKTPFIDAKLSSKEIHEYLDKNNIPYSKSTTCLATRIPAGTPVTREEIRKIRNSEDYILKNTDCKIVKVRSFKETGIVEVDEINEILTDNKFKQINDELKAQGFGKVCLNLSEIDDNEYIRLDYTEGSFSYKLPYTINLDETRKRMENINSYDEYKIQTDNITIDENGIIEGNDFKNYETASDAFMNILSKLRRNI